MSDARTRKAEFVGTPPTAEQLWGMLIWLLADQEGCEIKGVISSNGKKTEVNTSDKGFMLGR